MKQAKKRKGAEPQEVDWKYVQLALAIPYVPSCQALFPPGSLQLYAQANIRSRMSLLVREVDMQYLWCQDWSQEQPIRSRPRR